MLSRIQRLQSNGFLTWDDEVEGQGLRHRYSNMDETIWRGPPAGGAGF